MDARAGTLSGGNQQKVVVAREFERDLKLLVLDQPTRGLDVGSIEFIHRQVIAKRDAGTAILLVSAELDEVLEMSDRIAVMYARRDRRRRGRADGRQGRDRAPDGDRRARAAGRRTRGGGGRGRGRVRRGRRRLVDRDGARMTDQRPPREPLPAPSGPAQGAGPADPTPDAERETLTSRAPDPQLQGGGSTRSSVDRHVVGGRAAADLDRCCRWSSARS